MAPETLPRSFCQLSGYALDGIRAWTAPVPSFPWNSRFYEHSTFDNDKFFAILSERKNLFDVCLIENFSLKIFDCRVRKQVKN